MSQANIPPITPLISISTDQTIPLLFASIAHEEIALAHIINAEAEKLQLVLGTLENGTTLTSETVTLSNLLDINASVIKTLQNIIMKEMLLQFKFENVLELISISPRP